MTIPSVANSLPAQNGGSTNMSSNQLNMQQFLVMLSTQLATQNPLEPMSDRDFFAQLAQLGQVQGMDSMKSSLEATQTASLIGKQVTAILPYTDTASGLNEQISGTVDKVVMKNGKHYLVVKTANGGSAEVTPDQLQTIEDKAVAQS